MEEGEDEGEISDVRNYIFIVKNFYLSSFCSAFPSYGHF